MLCKTCKSAFSKDFHNIDGSTDSLASDTSKLAVPFPFMKVVHHTIPQLEQSALGGCHLCALLWDAAPSNTRIQYLEHLGLRDAVHWLPCYFTFDRSIFAAASSG